MKRAKLARLVDDEITRRHMMKPITFRTMLIRFDTHEITYEGRTIHSPHDCVTIPIISTDHALVPE